MNTEIIKEHFEKCWDYVRHRELIKGLPLSIVAGAGCAFLFGANPLAGAIFGTVNYVAWTVLGELTFFDNPEDSRKIAFAKCIIITGISATLTTLFITVVMGMPLAYPVAIPLAISSLIAGQLIRMRGCDAGHTYTFGSGLDCHHIDDGEGFKYNPIKLFF